MSVWFRYSLDHVAMQETSTLDFKVRFTAESTISKDAINFILCFSFLLHYCMLAVAFLTLVGFHVKTLYFLSFFILNYKHKSSLWSGYFSKGHTFKMEQAHKTFWYLIELPLMLQVSSHRGSLTTNILHCTHVLYSSSYKQPRIYWQKSFSIDSLCCKKKSPRSLWLIYMAVSKQKLHFLVLLVINDAFVEFKYGAL